MYCGATHIVAPNADRSDSDDDEIKQIEAVTRLLGNTLGMKVSKFTAEENIEERNAIKLHFKDGDDLQAIVAIKCLDEGVNIPGIKTAFILASTTNPKEYINLLFHSEVLERKFRSNTICGDGRRSNVAFSCSK